MTVTKEVLRIAIEEQRLAAQKLDDAYNHMKSRVVTYLGGGLAAVLFLYSRQGTNAHPADALFIPTEIYGQIFYFLAVAIFIVSIGLLLLALTPGLWEMPTEQKELRSLAEKNELTYLKYVKNRYCECFETNIKTYNHKQRLLNTAFYPLIFSVIILVVLNLFGG